MSGPIIETMQTHAEAGKTKDGMAATDWVKAHWTLPLLLLLAADFYWILWGNLTATIGGIILLGIVGIDAFVLKRSTLQTIKKYWPVIVILAIISLSMYIRLFGYFTPDGGTRWPYLRNIDSYYFLRETEDIISNNGVLPVFDDLRFAPLTEGNMGQRSATLYTYISAYSYSIVSSLAPQTVPAFMAWFASLLASLVAIPAYFIGKSLFDRKAGVLASIFMVLTTPFISRSLGGDPDSDAIVMLVAIASIAAFLFMHKRMSKEKVLSTRNILLAVCFATFLALFAYTWSGYWFTLWVVGSFIVLKIIADFALHRKHKEDRVRVVWKHTKQLVLLSLIGFVIFELLTVPYFGTGFATNFITAPLGAIFGGGYKGEIGQFPNVGVSIAEMQVGGDAKAVAINAAGLDTAAGVSGLPLNLLTIVSPFLLTLACLAYLGYSYYKRREHLDTLLFMGVWFVGFLFASTVAVRFTIFLAPVYAICSAIMLAKLWRVATGEDRSLGA